MNILAIETAGEVLSLACLYNNKIYELSYNVGFKHIELLLPAIDLLFNEARLDINQINLLAISSGPGSFTALRVGYSSVKGLALAKNIPIVSVPTLPAYASSLRNQEVLVVFDGRKNRFYAELFINNNSIYGPMDITLDDLIIKLKAYPNVIITGPAAPLLNLNYEIDENYNSPKAKFLIPLAQEIYQECGADADSAGPNYLRLSDAELALQPAKAHNL
ncbi:MAG: tRNA (adenosine(37)-N6)-threonylcarbamoyltransferase complex dimerization subunit type 1 TsaB [Spirochaetaceae bacterium]|nr:tRNA (adenosine(37)-N6)-threonylcarbamoyltransferase complex dimerization subunit type 1 TsaB [Spirochaetaceae bacterium]